MAHPNHFDFFQRVQKKFPEYFVEGKRVLDIGALDINGANRRFFSRSCEYIGLDLAPGDNVDVVSVAHEYESPNESFDVVLSSNALEHDMYYKKTLNKMVELLKPGGLMFFTVPYDAEEHGTKKSIAHQSATSQLDGEWANYYKTLSPEDIREVLDLDQIFEEWHLDIHDEYVNGIADTVFWGVKKENLWDKFKNRLNIYE